MATDPFGDGMRDDIPAGVGRRTRATRMTQGGDGLFHRPLRRFHRWASWPGRGTLDGWTAQGERR